MAREPGGTEAGRSAALGALPEDFFEGGDSAHETSPRRKGADAPNDATTPAVVVRRPVIPVVGAVVLGAAVMYLSGVLSGWALARKDLTATRSATAPIAATDPRVGRLEKSIGVKADKEEIDSLRAAVADVAHKVEELGGRLESLPKPAPAPDLGPIRERIDGLSSDAARLAALPEALRKLEERIGALDEGLGAVRGDVEAVRDRIKKVEVAATPPVVAETKPDPTLLAAQARERGRGLYREGKFAEARAEFLKGTEASPRDARLWYDAALANGFATRDWAGETERLVRLGVEAERTNTIPRPEIDAAFAGLPEEGGGRWLREWRRQAARP